MKDLGFRNFGFRDLGSENSGFGISEFRGFAAWVVGRQVKRLESTKCWVEVLGNVGLRFRGYVPRTCRPLYRQSPEELFNFLLQHNPTEFF